MKWGKLMHHDEQELRSLWEGCTGRTTKARGSPQKLCAKARVKEVEYIRRHKMHTSVPREACLRETWMAPIKTGWAETDKGQPGTPNVRARWVAKEYKDARRSSTKKSTRRTAARRVPGR